MIQEQIKLVLNIDGALTSPKGMEPLSGTTKIVFSFIFLCHKNLPESTFKVRGGELFCNR